MQDEGFWRYLLKKNLDARWLQGFPCAVFAIGDSGYQGLLQRSSVQGFHSLVQNRSVIVLGDDQDSSGYEKALGPWLLSFWKSLNRTNPSLLPRIQARPRALRRASKHSDECPCTSAPLPQTFRKKRIPLVWKMDSSRIYSSQWLYAAFNFSVY
ncbi:NADPH-dependent diflavin oxidoreductase 1-like isoform X2 [Triticum dicoccoides]|uniref:NADPH-dependent diflavin oxidoreductase 1-like isoform X2 n=1 Tax=Triticum dicoccoides TaxID=85692 RepID=UPI00188F6266|nr:NADPH-dependent diflavin oxidoreductase 1-like isoform X2 [Triticum dicoccoides]